MQSKQARVEITPRFEVCCSSIDLAFLAEVERESGNSKLFPLALRVGQVVFEWVGCEADLIRVDYRWDQGYEPVICILIVMADGSDEDVSVSVGVEYRGREAEEVAQNVCDLLLEKMLEEVRGWSMEAEGKQQPVGALPQFVQRFALPENRQIKE